MADGPDCMTNVESGSARTSGLPERVDEQRDAGIVQRRPRVQGELVQPSTTAATSSWIIWFAQSTLLLGSPPVTQMSRSMG